MSTTVSPTDRIERYSNKMIPERIKEDFTTAKPGMVSKETAIFASQAAIEEQVKALLGDTATASILYPWYYAYAKQIDRLHRHLSGTALVNEVALAVAKWKARGLVEANLIEIRDVVFGIPAPAAP
jgi:hypothetical protein